MNRIALLMIATMTAAASAAACGATEAGSLSGGYESGDDDRDPGSTASPTTKNDGEATPAGGVPTTGPGSKDSAAHKNFVSAVYPSLNGSCGSCHTAGTAGAPKFWSADASTTYQLLDGRGMVIGVGSLLVSHRHTGAGAEPNADQQSKMASWLALEAQERVGQKAPDDIMKKVGLCINAADWKTAENAIRTMRTRARNGENANTCTGCSDELCLACHNPGYGFITGAANDTDSTRLIRERPFINRFFGTNGTEPVASNALRAKADAVATGAAYSHPNFRMSAQVEGAINDFVAKTIASYKAGTCATGTP